MIRLVSLSQFIFRSVSEVRIGIERLILQRQQVVLTLCVSLLLKQSIQSPFVLFHVVSLFDKNTCKRCINAKKKLTMTRREKEKRLHSLES